MTARMILVVYKDDGDTPRAWARGLESERAAVEERAREQLARYISAKRALGEPMTAADFTRHLADEVTR